VERTYLRRDAARPTHMSRENWRPLQDPKRDSLWHHHLAGRVFLFSFRFLYRSCPSGSVRQRITGAGGSARTCVEERGGACLSAAARRSLARRRCIAVQCTDM